MKTINDTPKRNQEFELDINLITTTESTLFRDDFENYKDIVKIFLRNLKRVMSEEELRERFSSTENMEETIKSSIFLIKTAPTYRQTDGSFTYKYIDIADSYDVQPEDSMYDIFFAYKLRHISLLEIDDFLEYHFYFYYENDMSRFKRFLNLCLRTHKDKFNPETILTVTEWIEEKEKQLDQLDAGQLGKVRSKRPVRTNNDHKTSLTQEQTVLLAHYLQEKKVFYNGYLTDAEIATAFEILTGYSQNKLRLNLPKVDSFKTHENVKALEDLISNLASLIAKDLPQTNN